MVCRQPRQSFVGSGRFPEGGALTTRKQDFNAHASGEDFRHCADQINLSPALLADNVQDELEIIDGYFASDLFFFRDGSKSMIGDINLNGNSLKTLDVTGVVSSNLTVKTGTSNLNTGNIEISTGNSSAASTGNIVMTTGVATTGTSGFITITSGNIGPDFGATVTLGSASVNNGGGVLFSGGSTTASSGGAISVNGGSPGSGGAISIRTGFSSTISSGNLIVQSENSRFGTGSVTLVSGAAFDIINGPGIGSTGSLSISSGSCYEGNSGSLTLSTGSATTGESGDIIISAGTASTATDNGQIYLKTSNNNSLRIFNNTFIFDDDGVSAFQADSNNINLAKVLLNNSSHALVTCKKAVGLGDQYKNFECINFSV